MTAISYVATTCINNLIIYYLQSYFLLLGETGNLDARIKLIKKRNVEIERRENEIKKDREIFG